MKKKLLATAMVAVVAAIAGYNVYQTKEDVQLSDVQLANVEALAQWEVPPSLLTGWFEIVTRERYLYYSYPNGFGKYHVYRQRAKMTSCEGLGELNCYQDYELIGSSTYAYLSDYPVNSELNSWF
ncbi:MAG: NVEALA domain-containing protein [Mediterranea sp.]|nr:NVEALA domain-containing protein [Mediterranea sp.]